MWSILVYDPGRLGTSSSLAGVLHDGTVEADAASIFIEGIVAVGFGLALTRLPGFWRWMGVAGTLVGLISFAAGIAMFGARFEAGALPLLGIGTFVLWTLVVGVLIVARGVATDRSLRPVD